MRCFFFSSRRRHTRLQGDWSSDVCSSDLSLRSSCTISPAISLTASERMASKFMPLFLLQTPWMLVGINPTSPSPPNTFLYRMLEHSIFCSDFLPDMTFDPLPAESLTFMLQLIS